MSFWWYGRYKSGKRYWWLIDTDPMAVMMIIPFIAVVISLTVRQHPSVPFVLAISGLACLVISKISLLGRGVWSSFGPGLMSKGYASLYKTGHVLVGVGGC